MIPSDREWLRRPLIRPSSMVSIPPQKSDLQVFGLTRNRMRVEVSWSSSGTRINSPNGTTNMDFENSHQQFRDPSATPTKNCANNGVMLAVTPLRTVGDKLVTDDLAKGGTVPAISIRSLERLSLGRCDCDQRCWRLGTRRRHPLRRDEVLELGLDDPTTGSSGTPSRRAACAAAREQRVEANGSLTERVRVFDAQPARSRCRD